jgi:hypothetical protein
MFRLLLLTLLAAGCAGKAAVAPASAVQAYLAAGAREDPHAAYQLLAQPARAGMSEDEFAARWRASSAERKAQSTVLAPLASRPVAERARALWSDNRETQLVREPTGWRLQSPRVVASGAASPEEAVRHFTEALEHHDLDGLLDLMADPLRGLLERELTDRLARLKTALHKDIQVDGSRARIRFDDRYYLELKLEAGRWRIADFN